MSEIQEVAGARADAVKGRLHSIEKGLREVQRGVQLVRDKQVGGSPSYLILIAFACKVSTQSASLLAYCNRLTVASDLMPCNLVSGLQELAEAQAELAKLAKPSQVCAWSCSDVVYSPPILLTLPRCFN